MLTVWKVILKTQGSYKL